MRFLLDENVPLSVKGIVNNLGHEAIALKDEKQLGIKNGEVAELSIKKNAIIITLDSDFLLLNKELQKNLGLAAALSTGMAAIGAGIAVAVSGSAAIGAISEDSKLLGKTVIFVGLAEGIAIYGLIISIMILG